MEGYLDDTTFFWGDIGLHTCLEADDSVVR